MPLTTVWTLARSDRLKDKVKMGKSVFGVANKEKHKLQQANERKETNRKGHHKFHKEKYKKFKTNNKGFFTYIGKRISWEEPGDSLSH